MTHSTTLVNRARERIKDLPDLSPEGGKGGAERLRRALAGKERTSIVVRYERRTPADREAPETPLPTFVKKLAGAGVHAVQAVTEPWLHGGRLADLELIADELPVPVIMGDICIDPAYARCAAALGACGVELVAGVLNDEDLPRLVAACRELDLLPLITCAEVEEVARAASFQDAALILTDWDLDTLTRTPGRLSSLMDAVEGDPLVLATTSLDEKDVHDSLRGRVDAFVLGMGVVRHSDPASAIKELVN